MANNEIGRIGEDLALRFLLSSGYDLVARNFRIGHKELDLVMRHGKVLVFVEVKTRTNQAMGDGSEELEGKKAYKFSRAAELYIELKEWKGDIRLDLITIRFDGREEGSVLNHIKDIV